jgi:hypothetical protein
MSQSCIWWPIKIDRHSLISAPISVNNSEDDHSLVNFKIADNLRFTSILLGIVPRK